MTVAEKLIDMYPSGLVFGGSFGIVGELGLTVERARVSCSGSLVTDRVVFKDGEEVAITRVDGKWLQLGVEALNAWVHCDFLKGLRTYRQRKKPRSKCTDATNHNPHKTKPLKK